MPSFVVLLKNERQNEHTNNDVKKREKHGNTESGVTEGLGGSVPTASREGEGVDSGSGRAGR